MARAYRRAFALACPDVAADEWPWRYMFMAGAVVLAATDCHQGNRSVSLTDGRLDAADPAALLAALGRFVEGGMRYAAPAQTPDLGPA